MAKVQSRTVINGLNILGTIGAGIFLIWAFRVNLFTNPEVMRHYLDQFGSWAGPLFIFIQFIQVVLPIIPGAITIPVGILVFGHVNGFLLNFTGIMIGSVTNYYLAKRYGRPFVKTMVNEKQYNKYIGKIENSRLFDRLFTFGMFFPISPADLLCYLAGLSNMSFKHFFLSLFFGKPFTLLAYSYGLLFVLNIFEHLF